MVSRIKQTAFLGLEQPEPKKVLVCQTCVQRIGSYNPRDSQAGGLADQLIDQHRHGEGCPEGIPALVVSKCSLCPDRVAILPVLTTSEKEGDWWKRWHSHTRLKHGVDRSRKKERTRDRIGGGGPASRRGSGEHQPG